jgi:nicotinamidase-related amidase
MLASRLRRSSIAAATALLLGVTFLTDAWADEPQDKLHFKMRMRVREGSEKTVSVGALYRNVEWDPKKTALIVCDMWDQHHCPQAVVRVNEMAPRMNQVLEKARKQGVLIIHAPSSCMDAYKDHPARKRAQAAPKATNLPKDIGSWCYKIPEEGRATYPIEQSDGLTDCDCTEAEQKAYDKELLALGRNPKAPWKSQIDLLKIHDEDAISDSGVEIWNLLVARRIKNVILVGVHTNMCVLGRPFGLRQMVKNGKNTLLMRDLTDTMYNPKRRPQVSHFEGTHLIIEYIEQVVCPTITSDQIVGGQPLRFKGDTTPAKAPAGP